MDFGEALKLIKGSDAVKVRRKAWKKKEFIYFVPENYYKPSTEVAYQYYHGKEVPYLGYIAHNTDKDFVVPWCPTHADLISEDWEVVA